jgi:hypothetical protein
MSISQKRKLNVVRIFNFLHQAPVLGTTPETTIVGAKAGMKRGFLFGLASALCLGALFGLDQFSNDVIIAAIMVAITVPSSILVIRAAFRAPANRSRAHAITGWLVGFLIIDAVLLCIFGIVVIFSNLS